MKKIILSFALLLTLKANAQITVQTNVGISTSFLKENTLGWNLVNLVGLEFDDKFGVEYGYSYNVNNNTTDLYNYLYQNSPSYTAGYINHLLAVYFKSHKEDGSALNIGLGGSLLTTYSATNQVQIDHKFTPYIKLGLEHTLYKDLKYQINTGLGRTFLFTLGLSKKL